ncbi:hypothetical protein H310_02942 [Aphanomyces invadans]|uniref:Guanylate cyclase domain-containing protein n=1 Tax=Aphanomyces invadans TaxID=157072 RepID=A0A024ULR0_9STRA|nr:hypothetical protein H310_02942 [Aphanomyces invadans]ETW06787.1 hypothetical protein H310_02942 [Aphanomyces invadans]|eukprot:XP_008864862.1 hypothetical protein H310_02942 [Aphanomyces invadans]
MLASSTSKSAKVANKVSPEVQKVPPTQVRREQIVAHLDGRGLGIGLGIMTIFALFADDMRVSGFSGEADSAFYVLLILTFVGFAVEMAANMYARPGYFNRGMSFTFWMDLISTITILSDVPWAMSLIVPDDTNTKGIASASLQAGKAGRAGTKAGRMVKLIRLIRLIRVSRMFRNKDEAEEVQLNEPSKVGRILTELTTRRLIVLVLTMVIFLPVIDMSLSSVDAYQYDAFFHLHRLAQDYNATGDVSMAAFQTSFQEYIRQCDGLILSAVVYGIPTNLTNEWMHQMRFQSLTSTGAVDATSPYTLKKNPTSGWSSDYLTTDLSTLRKTDLDTSTSIYACYAADGTVYDTSCFSGVVFNIQGQNTADAHSSVGKTCIIVFVFGMSIFFFTKDSDQLVIGPVERMMALVNRLAENPLENVEVVEDLEQEYETRMLEKTIAKIGRLLQVGFGSAGTEIISKNMGGTGELNVMIPGKKISSIFGFGIIEHFTETCSILEESVITYINTLADIVHSDANMYYGAANKNIGSAFLIAWKICDGALPGMRDPRDPATKPVMDAAERIKKRADIGVMLKATGLLPRKICPQELVDSALIAVLRMRVEIHAANQPNGRFHVYLNNKSLQHKFDNHFHVAMGFGLHIGWAIEGAIGSKFKIDASYLSPNVNMAARLENATGQFQCDMLISEWFIDELSPVVKSYCRKVDRVTVKGSEIPMDLWTFDIGNYVDIPLPLVDPNGVQMPMDFDRHNFLAVLQEKIPREFFTLFNDGMQQYLDGHWDKAHTALTAAYAVYPDGPTDVLLKTLARENSDTNGGYAAPTWWKGFRPLTEK